MRKTLGMSVLMAAALLVAGESRAWAQATRTWVSGVGDDVNPGSRTAPCKTFAGVIAKTAPGGEINCLDSGGYGTLTITKSITIDGGGVHASILSSGVTGVLVPATATGVVVTLRNLSLNGAPPTNPGLTGIQFLGGGTLIVENCTITGFATSAIDFSPCVGNSRLFVRNTTIRRCGTAGAGTAAVNLRPTRPADPKSSDPDAAVVMDGVRLEGNSQSGVRAIGHVVATIRNCVISAHEGVGVTAEGTALPCIVTVEDCVISANGSGLKASTATGKIRCSRVTLVDNTFGIVSDKEGVFVSFGNNNVDGNRNDNDFPKGSILPQK